MTDIHGGSHRPHADPADDRGSVSYEEKGTWVFLLVAIVAYGVYLAVVLPRLFAAPSLDDVDYVPAVLWTIGGAIVGGIVLRIITSIVWPDERTSGDIRDREIDRLGERVGSGFVIAGAVAALALALFDAHPFWIANTIYLGFVLSALLSAITKLIAYRRGVPTW